MTYFTYFVTNSDGISKKIVHYLSLNGFSSDEVQIRCLRKQQIPVNIEVFYFTGCIIYCTISIKDCMSLLEIVWENTAPMKIALR